MTSTFFPQSLRFVRSPAGAGWLVAAILLILSLAVVQFQLLAQIEGDRGIAPLASSSDIQAGPVDVIATGKNAEEARANGWKMAPRKAWELIKGPEMGDAQLSAMVSSIIIIREQIGPRRYIATLSVMFDRSKAGQYIGGTGSRAHSAPLLVIPVLQSGGTTQVFEVRGAWQRAWAMFNTGASPIDYVRPSGAGGDSLLLTAGQPGRRSRSWWRSVLDQFSASDVIIPIARLERQWPGGPVNGYFTARYGPDNRYLESFTLTAPSEAGLPAMLATAVQRMDQIYGDALSRGLLRPDPTLQEEQRALDAALAAIRAAAQPKAEASTTPDASASDGADSSTNAAPVVGTYTVQFASPDVAAIDNALSGIRGLSGVQAAATNSIAIGGTSVMRVTYAGELNALAAALRARGWQVSVGSGALSIRR